MPPRARRRRASRDRLPAILSGHRLATDREHFGAHAQLRPVYSGGWTIERQLVTGVEQQSLSNRRQLFAVERPPLEGAALDLHRRRFPAAGPTAGRPISEHLFPGNRRAGRRRRVTHGDRAFGFFAGEGTIANTPR